VSRRGVERIGEAARRLGAEFGVSRPVAMNGWAPIDRTVGVSGVRSAPGLCIVAGASGAPALLWGVERAAFIVAVNTEREAPITTSADVVVLADAVAVVEALAELIDAGADAT
jgi:electron transfer flavoprotein alpha subunit